MSVYIVFWPETVATQLHCSRTATAHVFMGPSKFPSLQCCSNCCVDDHSRIVLQDADDNTSGYINANYIDVSPLCTLTTSHSHILHCIITKSLSYCNVLIK